MKPHYRAVVIGGGVVGASVLYHLTKFGWSDVALIERSVLTAGSSWHAAAGFMRSTPIPTWRSCRPTRSTSRREIEAESGQPIGMHMTGGINVARDPAALGMAEVVLSALSRRSASRRPPGDAGGDQGRLPDHRRGWRARGHVRPRGLCRHHGTVWLMRARPRSAARRSSSTTACSSSSSARTPWDVVTEQGIINAEHVVNAGGLMGEAGRADGRARPAALAARAPLSSHRGHSRNRGSSRPELPMVVTSRDSPTCARIRRACWSASTRQTPALVDGRRAMGLRRRAPAGEHRPHRRGARSSFTAAIRSCRPPGSANGSTAPSPSRRTAIRSWARSRASAAIGSLAASWPDFCRAAASRSRLNPERPALLRPLGPDQRRAGRCGQSAGSGADPSSHRYNSGWP